ncbi:hypothetical protein TSACC_2771 [Terrimicrobium sacchariphilum]|uniref:DUF3592 domain-containing protein n=1 Tax=Terrimicrobium sacchariphilum TaxID=690879 RepID=A0A146G4K6_TERSA|nr:DUF3592 domain-containing protein [Terrimicrobium sacchariphilum]GAT32373.1 hypothetical protein TSACC_2771 [Terrimicrobium sacchariphilum]
MNQRAMIAAGGVFGILLGMAIGGMHLLQKLELDRHAHWPGAEARVVSTRVISVSLGSEDSMRSQQPRVSLKVDGVEYLSEPKNRPVLSKGQATYLAKLVPGDTIRLRYNPDSPAETVLFDHADSSIRFGLACGAVVIVMGILFLVASTTIKESKDPTDPGHPGNEPTDPARP